MDKLQAWSVLAVKAKSAWRASATGTVNGLDALTPVCMPFALWWDVEADRRKQLRTPENLKALLDAQRAHNSARATAARAKTQRKTARAGSKNPLAAARRAARTADRAARGHHGEARGELRAARVNYPATQPQRAVRVHAVHTVGTAGISWALSEVSQHLTLWPVSLSAVLVGLNAGVLWLGRRTVTADVPDGLSVEERLLCERLDPSYWVQHADGRGLSGTVTTPPQITAAGIVCGVRLDDKWTAPDLKSKTEGIRALLGMRTETRMEVARGSHGHWARLVIRTRSASDGVSMIWTPDHQGIGVDEVTGDFVDIPLKPGVHVLVAGITGMGKSVSWRGLFLRAVASPEWTAVVIDPKRQEAIGVQHAVRAVGQEPNRQRRMADIYAMVQELTREMYRRQGIATGATWVPDGDPRNRFLLVVIDEGAAIVRMANDKKYADVLDLFEELWGEARAVGFQFIWATQNPTKSAGVPPLVKDNMSARLSLTTGAGEHERSIFGENAQQQGWTPSQLDGVPGRAMLQFGKRKPNPLRMWCVTDDEIAALPKADAWRGPAPEPKPAPASKDGRPVLTLVKDTEGKDATNRERILTAVRGGARSNQEVTDATGLNKGTVSRELKQLLEAGLVRRAADGTLAAGEVSA